MLAASGPPATVSPQITPTDSLEPALEVVLTSGTDRGVRTQGAKLASTGRAVLFGV